MSVETTRRFRIEKLEERIAPGVLSGGDWDHKHKDHKHKDHKHKDHKHKDHKHKDHKPKEKKY